MFGVLITMLLIWLLYKVFRLVFSLAWGFLKITTLIMGVIAAILLSETGYVQEVTVYECAGCKDCPVKEKCIRQKKTDKTPLEERVKRMNVSKYFIAQREAMEKKISTEEGILLRVNRSIQAEGVLP